MHAYMDADSYIHYCIKESMHLSYTSTNLSKAAVRYNQETSSQNSSFVIRFTNTSKSFVPSHLIVFEDILVATAA